MEQERITRALARIDAATRRIEAAARHAAAPPPAPEPDVDLVQRHERLRREAWAALAELDTVIEALEA